ncbi:LytTR family transcriptional regulator DNA-binding domain-containing protein [Oceanirhabdus seepicola]|uniref:LytTR family transcriptional regulator DNA-binding domain-containing protein n=1 Tax=Oceanirhabdus seepicola TaxID=2828781 RepID=A0A9J6P4W0_9CLOT|nr:LytTR family transcriptional regulator DNA-binding domain-containing protein [Oceanirhabdus seepicola]MCM1991818.1 LytTR family transcriptional regulator DNA-binding domain-containing protein [Oceanirhabdus seepicola]
MSRLLIEGIWKDERNLTLIEDLNIRVEEGQSIAIKCSEEIALLLINIILGKIIPPKGKVFIEKIINYQYINKNKNNIAVIFREEGFYERLSIKDYLLLFHKIYNSKLDLKEVMRRFALLDMANSEINTLTYSQRKRISFARALISNPKILLIQEPTLNLDRESTLIIRESIPYMNSLGISILAFSVSLEETILLEGDSYTLDEKGFTFYESDFEDEQISNEDVESEEILKPSFKIDKIPAKIDEKIILFNSIEINYIETLNGVTYINVGKEKFPCSYTLSKLEERLEHSGFFRCHRSYLVNLQKVREVITWTRNSYSLILDDKNKSSIPLSKGRIEELKHILNL